MSDEPKTESGWDAWFTPGRFTALLAALLFVAHWPALVGGQAFFYRDYGFLGYPFAWFHKQTFLAGEFPHWNSLIHCGVPFFAQWNTMVLYPGSLIYVLFPLPWSLAWFCVLHLLLAGVGMYRLGRETTGSNFAGAIGGTAFPFCGLVLGCLIYPNYLVAFAWMPWLLSTARQAWRGSLRDCVPAAIIGTLQMLSGAPELILLTWVLLTALMAGDAIAERSRRMAGRFALVALLITGLAAFQLLPFFQLLSLSQRSAETATAFWSLPPAGWINFLLPLFSSFTTNQNVIVQIGQSFLPSVYLGTIAVALAITALVGPRRREDILLAACGLVFLLWSFGPAFPPWRWLDELLPIGFARFPVKGVLPLAFIVALLAMRGAARLQSDASPWPGVVVVTAIILAGSIVEIATPLLEGNATLVLTNGLIRLAFLLGAVLILLKTPPRLRAKTAMLLPILIWADALLHRPILNPTIDRTAFQPGLALAYHDSALQPTPSRVMLSPTAERELHHRAVPKFFDDFIGQRLALWGNLNLLDGVAKVNGAATLTTHWSRDLEVQLYSQPPATNQALIDFLGVSHRTAPDELMRWQSRANPLPLVTAGQRTETRNKLPPSDWNPLELAFLPEDADLGLTNRAQATITNLRRSLNRIEFTAETDQPTIAVIAETWYPAWTATVNDRPASVLRANHAFMAVPLPPGRSTVRLQLRDRSFNAGLWLSAGAILACVALRRRGS